MVAKILVNKSNQSQRCFKESVPNKEINESNKVSLSLNKENLNCKNLL